MRYLIGYDLNAPGKNYDLLYRALAQLGASRVLLSEWVTSPRFNTSAGKMRDWLWAFMDGNDRLMVTCLDSSDWAGMNLMANPNKISQAS
jgi:hypothetical protein